MLTCFFLKQLLKTNDQLSKELDTKQEVDNCCCSSVLIQNNITFLGTSFSQTHTVMNTENTHIISHQFSESVNSVIHFDTVLYVSILQLHSSYLINFLGYVLPI